MGAAEEIRWDLVESQLGLAEATARRFSRGYTAERERYYDAAVDGLIHASTRYVADRGEFVRLASVAMRGRMIDALRRSRRESARPATPTFRIGLGDGSGEPLDVPAPPGPDPDLNLEEMVGWLPDREARALVLYFRGGLTCPEIGRAMGIHPRVTHRVVRRGIERLARRMTGR